MKRDVSTSTIGQNEERQMLMMAYMFQRRVLLGCSALMVVSLIIWIIAISTDHWIIISGGAGIFIPETRRFFISSHSGLWRQCRYTILPTPLPNFKVARNFTSYAYPNAILLDAAKREMSTSDFVKEFRNKTIDAGNMTSFNEEAKQLMFAYWVRNDMDLFEILKRDFDRLVLSTEKIRSGMIPKDTDPIEVNPVDVVKTESDNVFANALQKVQLNVTEHYIVIPEAAQMAIFRGWNEKQNVSKLLWPYVRDLGVPPYVLNEDKVILQLVPKKPPKKKGGQENGYNYTTNSRCQYIDMFPNRGRNDMGFDDTVMDYIRTQASFACITVFVMSLGAVFSFYTFMNPRYMFKRLAGGIHLVAASTAFVVIQVLMASVDYTRTHLFYAYPAKAELSYGYGVYLAWFTFGVNIICGVMFMWYSGKKKGSKAPTDELAMADEPTIIGR